MHRIIARLELDETISFPIWTLLAALKCRPWEDKPKTRQKDFLENSN